MPQDDTQEQPTAARAKVGKRVATYLLRVTVYDRDGDVSGRWDTTNESLAETVETTIEYEFGYDASVSAERVDE